MSDINENTIPDIAWYHGKSDAANVPKRCPFASAELCPRYYESLWLLGEAGITTKISEANKARLDTKWKSLEATIREEAASTTFVKKNELSDNTLSGFSHFCPEVSFNIFGYFASGLHRFTDEIDIEYANKRLSREGASPNDPRWVWQGVTPCHYTECREFSILSYGQKRPRGKKPTKPAPSNSQPVNIQNFNGVLGNVNGSKLNIADNSS